MTRQRGAVGSVVTIIALLALIPIAIAPEVSAAPLTATWVQDSNVDGFSIERAVGVGAPFARIGSMPGDARSFVDVDVADGTTYCYRMQAYSQGLLSDYSDVACATPTSVTAGVDTSTNAAAGTPVTPPPTPTPTPAGPWSVCASEHDTCVFTGTMEVRYGDGTTFTAPQLFTGSVLCDNSVFGDPLFGTFKHCEIRMPAVAALAVSDPTQTPPTAPGNTATLTVARTGFGWVSSAIAGIACGLSCSAAYALGTQVTLTAIETRTTAFTGWTGPDCSASGIAPCTVTLMANTTVGATFQQR